MFTNKYIFLLRNQILLLAESFCSISFLLLRFYATYGVIFVFQQTVDIFLSLTWAFVNVFLLALATFLTFFFLFLLFLDIIVNRHHLDDINLKG